MLIDFIKGYVFFEQPDDWPICVKMLTTLKGVKNSVPSAPTMCISIAEIRFSALSIDAKLNKTNILPRIREILSIVAVLFFILIQAYFELHFLREGTSKSMSPAPTDKRTSTGCPFKLSKMEFFVEVSAWGCDIFSKRDCVLKPSIGFSLAA